MSKEDLPTLGHFADRGWRVHLTCLAPGCRYGGRTFDARALAAEHGRDVTLDQLGARARCGEGHRGQILAEVSAPPPARQTGDFWGGT